MKESMRITPIGPRKHAITLCLHEPIFLSEIMNRIALRPFTFSNGLRVPTGTSISSNLYGTHRDQSLYPNADVFDGFRFVEPARGEKEETTEHSASKTKKTMYSTSSTYLSFGHGKHAW